MTPEREKEIRLKEALNNHDIGDYRLITQELLAVIDRLREEFEIYKSSYNMVHKQKLELIRECEDIREALGNECRCQRDGFAINLKCSACSSLEYIHKDEC